MGLPLFQLLHPRNGRRNGSLVERVQQRWGPRRTSDDEDCRRGVGGPPRRGVETAARSRGEGEREPHRGGSTPAAWPHTDRVGNGYAGRAATAGGAHADIYTTKQDGTAPNEEDEMGGPSRTPLQNIRHKERTGPHARTGGTL